MGVDFALGLSGVRAARIPLNSLTDKGHPRLDRLAGAPNGAGIGFALDTGGIWAAAHNPLNFRMGNRLPRRYGLALRAPCLAVALVVTVSVSWH